MSLFKKSYPECYQNVSAQSLLMERDVSRSGWLLKKSGRAKIKFSSLSNYDRRYFILLKGWVYYYKDERSDAPQGSFSLQGYSPRVVPAEEERTAALPFVLKVIPLRAGNGQRTWYLAPDTKDEMIEWKDSLKLEIEKYNISASRIGGGGSLPEKQLTANYRPHDKQDVKRPLSLNAPRHGAPRIPGSIGSSTSSSEGSRTSILSDESMQEDGYEVLNPPADKPLPPLPHGVPPVPTRDREPYEEEGNYMDVIEATSPNAIQHFHLPLPPHTSPIPHTSPLPHTSPIPHVSPLPHTSPIPHPHVSPPLPAPLHPHVPPKPHANPHLSPHHKFNTLPSKISNVIHRTPGNSPQHNTLPHNPPSHFTPPQQHNPSHNPTRIPPNTFNTLPNAAENPQSWGNSLPHKPPPHNPPTRFNYPPNPRHNPSHPNIPPMPHMDRPQLPIPLNPPFSLRSTQHQPKGSFHPNVAEIHHRQVERESSMPDAPPPLPPPNGTPRPQENYEEPMLQSREGHRSRFNSYDKPLPPLPGEPPKPIAEKPLPPLPEDQDYLPLDADGDWPLDANYDDCSGNFNQDNHAISPSPQIHPKSFPPRTPQAPPTHTPHGQFRLPAAPQMGKFNLKSVGANLPEPPPDIPFNRPRLNTPKTPPMVQPKPAPCNKPNVPNTPKPNPFLTKEPTSKPSTAPRPPNKPLVPPEKPKTPLKPASRPPVAAKPVKEFPKNANPTNMGSSNSAESPPTTDSSFAAKMKMFQRQ